VVDRRVHAEMVERLVARAAKLTIGHGLRRSQFGPLNSTVHLDKVAGYLSAARERGITVATGGNRCSDPETGQGWFFEPTILDNVGREDAVVQEEIFGPVLTVQVADGAEEALEIANCTPFGLVAGIYTRDFATAHRLARDIEAGQVFINEYFAGGIEVPFGGTKMSGFGREKGLAALEVCSRVRSAAARIEG